jgi:hypothetical protein
VESVQKLAQLIGEVSAASEEQSKGIEQIGTAVTQMDKLTQANAANAEESASASEELAAQAKELGDMVRVLVGIVKGEGAREAFAPAERGGPALPRAAAPVASLAPRPERKPAARPAPAKAQADWTTAGKTKVPHARSNGHAPLAVASNGHAANPEQAIPMDDADLKDF